MLIGRVLMSRRFRFAHNLDGPGSIARIVDFAGTPFFGLPMAARERVLRDRNMARRGKRRTSIAPRITRAAGDQDAGRPRVVP